MSDTTSGGAPSSGIRRSSSSRPRKKKKSQIPYGILAALVIAGIGVFVMTRSSQLGFFWFTGIAFGFILQKARFCFTASLRDPFLTGGTSLTKAVLTAFAVTSIGFWAIMYGAHAIGAPVPGMSFVAPVGVHTAVGAFIFGIGMVISGGCASGTLMRVGEGFGMQFLSIIFFVVGSLLGAATFGWWQLNFIATAPRVHLPELFGWFGAIVVQLLIIVLLWIAADKFAKRKQGASSH
ncbi:MAG: YeeE/YedE thiosulfate transporter family protein [Alkalispirochaetaceae bacterium]